MELYVIITCVIGFILSSQNNPFYRLCDTLLGPVSVPFYLVVIAFNFFGELFGLVGDSASDACQSIKDFWKIK